MDMQGKKQVEKIPRQLSKDVNLPFYDDEKFSNSTPTSKEPGAATAAVESWVRAARLKAGGVADSVYSFNNNISAKYNTAKAHTMGVVDFFQSEPELWQRCGIVAAVGLTGFISGYRRPVLIKSRNMLLSASVAATICWPQPTVEVVRAGYSYVMEPALDLWTKYSPGSPYHPVTTAQVPPTQYYSNKPAGEDHGQSNSEDQDMYSTRGSS